MTVRGVDDTQDFRAAAKDLPMIAVGGNSTVPLLSDRLRNLADLSRKASLPSASP